MNIVEAEQNLKKIINNFSKDSFVFDLMTAYDFPKSTISKIKIKNKSQNDVVVPTKLHFAGVSKNELDSKFDELVKEYSNARKAPRFIIVTDYQNLRAYDTKVAEKLNTEIKNLSNHPDFFLPWAGIEKKIFQGENPADVKAAEKLAKFFDLILKDNLKLVEKERHALNVFLTRILFCFFAEDTDIFKKGIFTESIASHTKDDGTDLDDYLHRLFDVLNKKQRNGLPDYLKDFPYVNGGLFAEEFQIPKFSKKSRESLIDLGSDLNWAEINPDIFGSMIQAVVHPDQRAGLGMHYTSVTNIMKVIEPLFLAELKEEFLSANGNKNKLKKLLERIESIKIFDPACGSGNFLIIAYKELRLLEMDILKTLGEIPMSGITLSNFIGIEIDDFAHEVAKLSLWLAEHQMDVLFNKQFGAIKASLPLKDSGKIFCENATEVQWQDICKPSNKEIYIIGNPPYLGSKVQNDFQKNEMEKIFKKYDDARNFDYIFCWFLKAAEYISSAVSASAAFVSTNSVNQGEQVSFWKIVEKLGVEFGFAHQAFKWSNSAKKNAGVMCVVIGLRKKSTKPKFLFDSQLKKQVKNINFYLVDGPNRIIERRSKPISKVPEMSFGSIPYDGGHLILSKDEKNELLSNYPDSKKFIRLFVGSEELINGPERYCLWIEHHDSSEASSIPPIKKRLELVSKFRKASKTQSTQVAAKTPYRFKQDTNKDTGNDLIIIPRVSSERREYIPINIYPHSTVTSDAQVIYNADLVLFGILSSRLHLVWVKALTGRLETRIRYSSAVCYNNFPFPALTDAHRVRIEDSVRKILFIRQQYLQHNLAFLYDPKTMPKNLLEAHKALDGIIEGIYRDRPFKSDEEILEHLFIKYEEMLETM